MIDKATVQRIADRLREDCFEAHRGAFWWDKKRRIAVAFGNDGDGLEGKSGVCVDVLRRMMAGFGGATELGFATSTSGDSWVLVCELRKPKGMVYSLTPKWLEGTLWAAWENDGQMESVKGTDIPRAVSLNWAYVQMCVEDGFATNCEDKERYTTIQANIARGVLERNGFTW